MNEQKILEVNSLVRSNSRTDLIAKCKEKNLSATGTKHDMAVRLIGGWASDETKTQIGVQPVIPQIIITKNAKGLWIFENIVFDDNTKNAIGYLAEDGTQQPLQRHHIEICKRYKFRYVLPNILDEDPTVVRAKETVDTDSDDESVEEGDMEETPLDF